MESLYPYDRRKYITHTHGHLLFKRQATSFMIAIFFFQVKSCCAFSKYEAVNKKDGGSNVCIQNEIYNRIYSGQCMLTLFTSSFSSDCFLKNQLFVFITSRIRFLTFSTDDSVQQDVTKKWTNKYLESITSIYLYLFIN